MREYLWINRWNDKRKSSAIENQKSGSNFLSSYQINDFRTVLYELMVGLNMIKGSESSGYVCFIPPSGNEVVKIRLSDHPSTIEEWNPKEISGLPNRRYSIVIFSNKSMPNDSKQKIKELDWKNYEAEKIPVYEKTFNRYYLKETFPQLLSILQAIYRGDAPEDNTLPMNITENKDISENIKMSKKQVIRLNEAQLKQIVTETVKKIIKEGLYGSPYHNSFTHDSANMPNPNYDDIGNGYYYAAPDRDSDEMFNDDVTFRKKEKKNNKMADKRWVKSADSRPLHRKNSPNREIMDIVKETVKRVLKESRHNDDRYWYFSERGLNREVYVPLVFNKEFVRQFDDMSNEQLYNAVLGLYDYIEGDDMPDINNRNEMCEWIWEYADDMLRNY